MTDMTAEQALEWLESLHEIVQGNAISQNKWPEAQAAAKAFRQALSAPRVPDGETVTFWVVYDATTDKRYIKKNAGTGAMAMFEYEHEAQEISLANHGTGYKQVTYIKPATATATKEAAHD